MVKKWANGKIKTHNFQNFQAIWESAAHKLGIDEGKHNESTYSLGRRNDL